MVENEEEVVRALRLSVKVAIRNDVTMENSPKYLGREESRHVQQGIAGAFASDYRLIGSFNLLFQRPYGIKINLPVLFVKPRQRW